MLFSIFNPFVVLLVVWAACAKADFEIYRFYDEDALVAGIALSRECLAALNATVHCDESTINLLGSGADIHCEPCLCPDIDCRCETDQVKTGRPPMWTASALRTVCLH